MEQLTHIFTLFSATAAGSLVTAIWEGTVLAAGVALCLYLVKGISAGFRSLLWTGVLLLVVLLHFMPFFEARPVVSQAAPGRIFHLDLHWSMAIVCLWALFSLVRAAQLIRSAIGLRRVARRATPVVPSPEIAALLRTRLRSARLCTSPDVDRPSVIGFFAPRVLVPQFLHEKLPPFELEQIVMHEMEHLRRADDWINLLQKISLVLFPLNPALLWVERRLCVERELACDDRVLHLTRARKAYATCLVNLAEHSVLRRSASLVLGAWERQSELGQRVRRILRQPEGMMGRRQMKIVTTVLVIGMLGGAATLAREPQLVSFAPLPIPHAETGLTPPPGYMPVSFRNTAETPRMVKTVFHEPAAAAPVAPKKTRTGKSPHAAVATAPVRTPAHAATMQRQVRPVRSWVVLTTWTDSPTPSRLRLVVSGDSQTSYAAVPVMNGWLIVQL